MLNVIELESRWFKYKVKSYLPYLSILISLIIIIIVIFSFMQNPSTNKSIISTKQPVKVEKKVAKVSPKKQELPITKTPIKKPIVKKIILAEKKQLPHTSVKRTQTESIKLSPSLDFMKKMQNSLQPYYVNEHTNSNTETPTVETKKESIKANIKVKPIEKESHKINIKRQNTQHDIQDIVKRFKNNNNPALSLFVAKKYYELGNYNQSYNYALITNKINKEIDISWIIFTKSLVKLGKRDKAISTLKKYIKQSHSSSAQILLDEIRSGKFQ